TRIGHQIISARDDREPMLDPSVLDDGEHPVYLEDFAPDDPFLPDDPFGPDDPFSSSRPFGPDFLAHPETLQPGTLHPETLQPETPQPGTLHPEALHPGTLQPGTLQPGTLHPERQGDRAIFGDGGTFVTDPCDAPLPIETVEHI